ncbi:LytR/AlgR family response regulator transcription factor [Haloimpatiens massiliensis]|uniref:LytR/AlgR family response regulator transcription factor n=1 Tax=Haloimpatiens massiliensis TaxID=1658110 RepID=UPI000C858089|nr:LytTR family DNA-binding domain-containing protein [Haloimpatiens massiliensis]
MNIAVVEDNYKDMIRLEGLLNLYKGSTSTTLNIDFFITGEAFLETGVKKKYHLIFMDIYMGQLDGIETAICLRKVQEDALIVFLTSSDEDIWRAVRTHGCFDYIQKSELNIIRLEKLLKDAMNKWNVSDKNLVFQSGKQEVSLKLHDIQYIVARNKYTVIVLKNNQERSYRSTFSILHDLVKENSCFLLCNRGVLLNMDFIQQSDGENFAMQDGTKFPMRRKGRKEIIEKFNDYQFERLDAQEVLE